MLKLTITTLIAASLCMSVSSKSVEGTIKFEQFRKHACQFVTKYGALNGQYVVDLKYYLYGKFATERFSEMSDADTHEVSLVAVSRQTHIRLKELIENGVTDVWERIAHNLEKEIKLDIMNDGKVVHRYTHQDSDIHYFYFCDHSAKVRHYQTKKHNMVLEKQKQNSEELNKGIDVASIFNKIVDLFGHSSSFKYELMLVSDAEKDQFIHHSLEQRGTHTLLLVFYLMFVVLFTFLVKKMVGLYKTNEAIDHPLLVIAVTLGLQIIGMMINFIHFSIYSSSGNDLQFLNIFARLWYLAADALISMLLIMMSKGWGIAKVSLFDDYEIEFVIGILLLSLRYLWVILGFFVDIESEEVLHVFDGVTGKLELINTLVLYAWFMFSISSSDLFKAYKLQSWKQQLTLYSTLLLFVKPVVILLVYFTNHHDQHLYSNLVSYVCYFTVCLLLTYKMTDIQAEYLKVAVSNAGDLCSHKGD